MKIKVVRAFHEAVGCPPHKIGTILEVNEKRAKELIDANFCVAIEEEKKAETKPRPKRVTKAK